MFPSKALMLATVLMEEQYESFLDVDFWTMIFAWANLVILFLILKKILFKPLKNMIDKRQSEISDLYADAEKSKKDAAELRADYETKLEKATEESEKIIRDATRKAQLKEEEILHEAQENASKVLARAEEQIDMEKKQALNDIKDEVSGMAVAIASAVLERDVKEDENQDIINNFIENLGDKK